MKNFGKLAVLGAALAVSATYAFATPITGSFSVAGGAQFTSTTLTVDTTGTIGSTANYDAPTGSFASSSLSYALANTAVTLAPDIAGSLPQLFLTGAGGPGGTNTDGLTFTLDTYNLVDPPTAKFWDIAGPGMFTLNGYDPTLFSFTFTANNSAANGQTVAFTGNSIPAPAIPEPNSLILLGTGLLGAGGMLMRRRRLTA